MSLPEYAGQAIRALYPEAVFREDYRLERTSGVIQFVYWNTGKLGPQPTLPQIEGGWRLYIVREKKNELRERERKEFDSLYASAHDLVLDVVKGYSQTSPPGNKIPMVSANRDQRDRGEQKIDELLRRGAAVETIQAESWETANTPLPPSI